MKINQAKTTEKTTEKTAITLSERYNYDSIVIFATLSLFPPEFCVIVQLVFKIAIRIDESFGF